jgi:hypothetical protein
MYTKFWLANLKGTDDIEDLHIDGRTTLKWILKEQSSEMQAEFIS